MKIRVTEIEATAEDIRANRSIGNIIYDALARALDPDPEKEAELAEGDQE